MPVPHREKVLIVGVAPKGLPRGVAEDHLDELERLVDTAGGQVVARFVKEREVFGDLLNTTKVLAHCPPILRAAKQLGASIERSGRLPSDLLPLVYLRVALINGCPF